MGTIAALHGGGYLERDEDGVWCAHVRVRPGVGAHGYGDTPDEAVADLEVARAALIEAMADLEV